MSRQPEMRTPNYGNGITEGICPSIFPLSSSLLVSSSDDDGGQSTGENVCRLHSVDPCASTLNAMAKYPSNTRKKTEIHLNDSNGALIYLINRTSQPSIFDLPITNLS